MYKKTSKLVYATNRNKKSKKVVEPTVKKLTA